LGERRRFVYLGLHTALYGFPFTGLRDKCDPGTCGPPRRNEREDPALQEGYEMYALRTAPKPVDTKHE
jgi:hypothetical protein